MVCSQHAREIRLQGCWVACNSIGDLAFCPAGWCEYPIPRSVRCRYRFIAESIIPDLVWLYCESSTLNYVCKRRSRERERTAQSGVRSGIQPVNLCQNELYPKCNTWNTLPCWNFPPIESTDSFQRLADVGWCEFWSKSN